MRNLLMRLLLRYRLMVSVCALLLAAFQLLMCAIIGSTDVTGAMQQIMAFAPPAIQVVLGQALAAGASDSAMLAFGWNHPITHALGSAVAITLGARAVAGEIENGAIEQILTQPISRARYLAAQIVFALLAVTTIVMSGMVATVVGLGVFELDEIPVAGLGLLMLAFVLLQMTLFAVTLLFSAAGREGGRAAFGGLLVALVSYMIDAVASLWPRVASLQPLSLHHYYDPRTHLVEGRLDTTALAVFLVGTTVMCALAMGWFRRRDLP